MAITSIAPTLDVGVFGGRAIPSTYSGYETFLTTLLPELVSRGHRVTMYCRPGEIDSTVPYRGVERRILPAVRGKDFNTLSHGAVAAVSARLARHDVVLVVNVANSLFSALNKLTGQPVVLNTDGQEWLRGKWGPTARRIFKLSARFARRGATALVADCAAMADVYRSEFGAQSTVIPYCFPTVPWTVDEQALSDVGVEAGEYYIIAGRLNPENNIDRVAEAYSKLRSDRPLLVLGAANYDSPVTQRLRDIAAADPRVRPVGHVNDRQAFLTMIGSAAAYIHGHSVGGMNPSLVEAMRAGAYVLALDTPFNRETLGDTGSFFTLDRFSESLDRVDAMTPRQQSPMRRAAEERVERLFNVEEVVTAYEQLLAAAAAGSARRQVSLETRWDGGEADAVYELARRLAVPTVAR